MLSARWLLKRPGCFSSQVASDGKADGQLRPGMWSLPEDASETYYKAFQPRLGLAYSMLADRMALRAGGGIYQGLSDLARSLFPRILGQNPALGPMHPYGYIPASPRPDLFPARNFFLTANLCLSLRPLE